MSGGLRPDLAAIAEMIDSGARVLDIGCDSSSP
jgi:tRNA A22 N-methylase